jgi:(E)-4-hydroxy-3-methylbut-2-enyl-diphosphate synthase
MEAEGMRFPLHLGVTEAGNGLEGRIKSAVGIGTLLADGLGDTIRVSLTEPPENEIPVARAIVDYFADRADVPEAPTIKNEALYHPFEWSPRRSVAVGRVGGSNLPVIYSELGFAELAQLGCGIVAVDGEANAPTEWRAAAIDMMAQGDRRPIILHKTYTETTSEALAIKTACDFGLPLLDGLADGVWIDGEEISQPQIDEISLAILQAARLRMSRAEFIACPGCGRTLYDLAPTLERIKAATAHLAGLKIGVMGCIVNGPGEMADADYGYVGAGPGRITLYRGQQVVRRDIPQSEALDALIELLKVDGKWRD